MRFLAFSKRTVKEILRDPLNIFFGLGFPIILMLFLHLMQINIEDMSVNVYEIDSLAPAISVFGMCFMTTFSAILIAKDRDSSFMQRLYTTPLKPIEFILGYAMPLLPLSMLQSIICYLVALGLGMTPTVNIIYNILLNLPSALFFISLGLLCGSVLGMKQVGGICGALLSNVAALCSGMFFDLKLLGDGFYKVMECLPYMHTVELSRAVMEGDFASIVPHIYWVLGYSILITIIASLLFLWQTKRQ